ncbi:MAG: glycoside hydrolase family 5 protein [Oscillospiraceae bacterium]|nr:glycoside hydrolase family 5 protein [Oscillospiraceae bacterium]
MRNFKKLISAVTASVLTLSMAAGGAIGFSTASAADKTAVDIVNDMGLGWNLGNTFDAWGAGDVVESAWGAPKTTQAMITGVKSAGFDSIRIPITWYEHMDANTYDINDSYLDRIKEVVDYAYKNDMYVIINMHWDSIPEGTNWLNEEADLPQFTTMWTEIANYFKDYDNHLVFEDMNEVAFTDNPYSSVNYDVLNKFNQSFVDLVRKSGGNNADRLLLLAGANDDVTMTCNTQYVVPNDKMVAVSMHYYSPSAFCIAQPGTSWGYESTWGTEEEVQKVYSDFNKIKSFYVDKGIPVIIGEYGVLTESSSQKDKDSILKFVKTVASAGLETNGMSTFLWDGGGHADMNFFNKDNLGWYDSRIGDMYKELSSKGATAPEGYTLTNKAIYKADQMEKILNEKGEWEGNYNIDLKQYKDLANIVNVVIEGTISSGQNSAEYSGGGVVAFNATQDGGKDLSYTTELWSLAKGDTSAVVELDGVFTDDDGNDHTYVMDYDYMNINTWWTWSKISGDEVKIDIEKVTLIFDKDFYLSNDYVSGGNTDPDPTIPTEPEPTGPAPTPPVPPAPEPTDPVVDENSNFFLHGQFGGNRFLKNYYGTKVEKSGTYTIEIPATGKTQAGDMMLFLDTDVNIYDYALNEDSDGLKDGTLKIAIDSV